MCIRKEGKADISTIITSGTFETATRVEGAVSVVNVQGSQPEYTADNAIGGKSV